MLSWNMEAIENYTNYIRIWRFLEWIVFEEGKSGLSSLENIHTGYLVYSLFKYLAEGDHILESIILND